MSTVASRSCASSSSFGSMRDISCSSSSRHAILFSRSSTTGAAAARRSRAMRLSFSASVTRMNRSSFAWNPITRSSSASRFASVETRGFATEPARAIAALARKLRIGSDAASDFFVRGFSFEAVFAAFLTPRDMKCRKRFRATSRPNGAATAAMGATVLVFFRSRVFRVLFGRMSTSVSTTVSSAAASGFAPTRLSGATVFSGAADDVPAAATAGAVAAGARTFLVEPPASSPASRRVEAASFAFSASLCFSAARRRPLARSAVEASRALSARR
mmetsp:Transcript_5367/g.21702  ORF Transcript_5367/g.21702 Transcript_5367/m.21702 type:complete len:274 (+) Transcript_5367:2169-2990(+)